MPDWRDSIKRLEAVKQKIGTITGNEMVNFALDNIQRESWEGKKWKPRKPGTHRNQGRKLLVDTGKGRRSIRISKSSITRTELEAVDYMEAHNEGVHQTVNAKSRKGKSYTMKMNLPQRQWTGKSEEQTARIENLIKQEIVKALT